MDEIWAPIPGFPNHEVSTWGRVRNQKTVMTQRVNGGGYMKINLCHTTHLVHRLVAMTFLEDWDPTLTVDHIDRDRMMNRVDNLRMATRVEQARNRASYESSGSEIRVEQWKDGVCINSFESIKAAAAAVGHAPQSISGALNGRTKGCGGYQWKYETSPDLDGEIWKQFDDGVWLSNKGRIRRNGITKCGRDIWKGGETYPSFGRGNKAHRLHVEVAKLFVHKPDESKIMVNHKDGDRANASADNLEWVTSSENCQHAHDIGLVRIKRAVDQLDENGAVVKSYDSIKEAAKAAGVSVSAVSHSVNGRRKRHRMWQYRVEVFFPIV